MFQQIRLSNFFSYKDEVIDLNPGINLLIGINGSGKSNLIRAFELLDAGMHQKLSEKILDWGGIGELMFKSADGSNWTGEARLKFVLDGSLIPEERRQGPSAWSELNYEFCLSMNRGESNYSIHESLNIVYAEHPGGQNFILKSGPNNSYIRLPDPISLEKTNSDELLLPQLGATAPPELVEISEKLKKELASYTYFNTFPNSPMRGTNKGLGIKRLQNFGGNLAQTLNTIKNQDRPSYLKLLEKVREVNPFFEDLDFRFLGSGILELLLAEKGLKSVIHISQISDGTLRFLCLAAISFNADRGKLICIDEPEIGLHPDMIVAMAHMLDHAAMENSQFLVATHSTQLLDLYRLENVLVFEKDDDNSTKVKKLNEKEYEGWRDQFEPGKMWRAGDLGGNRW